MSEPKHKFKPGDVVRLKSMPSGIALMTVEAVIPSATSYFSGGSVSTSIYCRCVWLDDKKIIRRAELAEDVLADA